MIGLLRPLALSMSFALALASGGVHAQPAPTEEAPPPAATPSSTPPRPVVMPMTPGSELRQQTPKPATPAKPRIVSAPGTAPADTAAAKPIPGVGNLQPERRVRNPKSDYWFCNRTSYVLSIAVGARNGGLISTRGWWIVPAGDCLLVIKGEINKYPAIYTFARSSFAHSGSIRTWGGSQALCTGKGNTFQATSDGSDQCGPGYEAQGFARVDTEGKTGWTTTLTETPGYKSLDHARIAGLQRLLADLGRFEGSFDGVPGPKFSESLGQVRAALGVALNDASGLYNKLHAEAAKNQAGAGLTFCNRTQDIIFSALGIESEGKKRSMGWWRLQPGQCEKVIKDRLAERYVYAYAVADRTEGVPESWGGTKQFCTRDPTFEIPDASDCQGRSFKSTGFLEIDTGGRPGLTFEFAARKDASQ